MTKTNSNGTKQPAHDVDVAVLGTGVGGTMLGAILAKAGLRVLLLESGMHPRFAIGESTVPETTFNFRLLAARYGVPEIGHLANFARVMRHVGNSHGVKRGFSYVWHREGERQDPQQTVQFATVAPPLGPDVHFFRQDLDGYMLAVAAEYGARIRQRTEVTDVAFDDDGVTLTIARGEPVRARFLVDAGGIKSLLATKLDLRINPCPLRNSSRTIYSHFVNVPAYDTISGGHDSHGLPYPISQCTLHHLFDGGWFWVIPFNNHPSSTNRLVSVGVTMNVDRWPKGSAAPEEEFRAMVDRFPSVREQLGGATAIRDYLGTDRLQFYSKSAVGPRYALLPHAAAFVDPLFSSGLGMTVAFVNLLADRLLAACRDDDFAPARFAILDETLRRNIRHYDRLVSGAYTSFRDFALWTAWSRIWMLGSFYGLLGLLKVLHAFDRTGDEAHLRRLESFPYRGQQASELPQLAQLFDRAEAEMDAVKAGTLPPSTAATRIFGHVKASRIWPEPWGAGDSPATRTALPFHVGGIARMGLWILRHGPAEVREHFMPEVGGMLADYARGTFREVASSQRGVAGYARDTLLSWNEDWTGGA
jgi:FADH2 O2-dependent halogenase